MEEVGNITLRFSGLINGSPITPQDIDISEIKNIISGVEALLYPNKGKRPHISYNITEGSAIHTFTLPISAVLVFSGIIEQIADKNSIDFLNNKQTGIFEYLQKTSNQNNTEITLSTSLSQNKSLTINDKTKFIGAVSSNWIFSNFLLYGEIYEEGGMKPNIHIKTKEFGNLTISASKEKILEGEKRIYKTCGIAVNGKQDLDTGKLYELELEEFINYNPVFDKDELDELIKKAAPQLAQIEDVDEWLRQIR